MILVAESGSSKTDWCLLDGNREVKRISTIGLNPYFVSADFISDILKKSIVPLLDEFNPVTQVYFYGAGCSTDKMCEIVRQGLSTYFKAATIFVYSDMIAAARALCGNGTGFVCILGTGSNSCAYQNGKIIEKRPALGYVLGDEGSGTDLGKKLLRAYCYKELTPTLQKSFELKFQLNEELILESIYKKAQPNRFIASVVPFIKEHMDTTMKKMLSDSFQSFLQVHIKKFKNLPQETPIFFTGSVASSFADTLQEEVEKSGLVFGAIQQSPLEGLLLYHIKS